MKKKSTIFAIIAVAAIAIALYFMRSETVEVYEELIPEEEEPEELPEPTPRRRKKQNNEDPIELIPDISKEDNEGTAETN